MSAPSDDMNPPPSSLMSSDVPSSFDSSPEFFDENRWNKLFRRLREEPLIPLGCLATSYALYMASKSMRAGDHHQTNRMFRARIYAQGFTLVAVVAGSVLYKDERMKRKEFQKVIEDRKNAEKREKWLHELEMRDKEDREWRERFEGVAARAQGRVDAAVDPVEKEFKNRSVLERTSREGWGPGTWVLRTSDAWKRK